MLNYDFPLDKKSSEDIMEHVGINPTLVFNRGALLFDEWGKPISEKYSMLAEWARKRMDGGRIICAVTIKSFKRDGKFLFSADKEHSNTVFYAVLYDNQRIVHPLGTVDSSRQIVEYSCADAFDYEKRRMELSHKDQIIDLLKDHQNVILKVSREGLRATRDVAAQGGSMMAQRMVNQQQPQQRPMIVKQKSPEENID